MKSCCKPGAFDKGCPDESFFFLIIKLLYISVLNDYISFLWNHLPITAVGSHMWREYEFMIKQKQVKSSGYQDSDDETWEETDSAGWSDWGSFLFMLQNWKNTWKINKAVVCCSGSSNLAHLIKSVIAPFFQKSIYMISFFAKIDYQTLEVCGSDTWIIWHPKTLS